MSIFFFIYKPDVGLKDLYSGGFVEGDVIDH